MRSILWCICIVIGWSAAVLADQRVSLAPDASGNQTATLDRAYDAGIMQEAQALTGGALPAPRLQAIMTVLTPERRVLALGASEVPSDANSTDASNAANGTITLDVRVNADVLRDRLRDLGVLYTARESKPYVLTLEDVDPSRTKRLGTLQEISGLRPVPGAGPEVPVLRLSQFGAWTGVLSAGDWSATKTSKSLDEVWFTVWKSYFTRSSALAGGDGTLTVRVAGWLSSLGPMEFDRQLDSWKMEIESKTLVGVEMDGPHMAGIWRMRAIAQDALLRRLDETVRAQGLSLKVDGAARK